MFKELFTESEEINEAAKKLSIQWVAKELVKILKKQVIASGEKFQKDAVQVSISSCGGYYGEEFRVRPVNQLCTIRTKCIYLRYKKKSVYQSALNSNSPLMMAGHVIANIGNRMGSTPMAIGETSGDAMANMLNDSFGAVFFGDPRNSSIHKIYKDQKSYVPSESSSSMTYYDKAYLTPAAIKKVNATAKKSVNVNNILEDAEEQMSKYFTSEAQQKVTTPTTKKSTSSSELKVGDWVDSKNGMEFSAKVTKISGGKVTVVYDIDGYGDEKISTVRRSEIKGSDGEWYAASWTF